MCLVALAWNIHPHWPLVLIGNRDEHHARPSAALHGWSDAPIWAGRDLRSGGTWMGLGRNGRAAVVTNVRDGPPQPVDGPSRGALPAAFLASTTSAHAFAQLQARDAAQYAPFNVIVADRQGCAYVGNHPARGVRLIAPGVHALSNGDFDEDWPKTRNLRDVLRSWVTAGSRDLTPLWVALSDRTQAPDAQLPHTGVGLEVERRLSPAFIHEQGYGTRASTLILVDEHGHGTIIERRFGSDGVACGETSLTPT